MWIQLTLMMLALVNGADAVNYKHFRTLNVYFVDQIMLSSGMDAVSYKQLKNLTACSGDSILLSSGVDDVNSHNPNGC